MSFSWALYKWFASKKTTVWRPCWMTEQKVLPSKMAATPLSFGSLGIGCKLPILLSLVIVYLRHIHSSLGQRERIWSMFTWWQFWRSQGLLVRPVAFDRLYCFHIVLVKSVQIQTLLVQTLYRSIGKDFHTGWHSPVILCTNPLHKMDTYQ